MSDSSVLGATSLATAPKGRESVCERERVCVSERERESVCVREREKESVPLESTALQIKALPLRPERECVRVRERVCVRGSRTLASPIRNRNPKPGWKVSFRRNTDKLRLRPLAL